MSDESEIIVAALADRLFQEVAESRASSNAALIFSVAALASVVRSGALTVDEATRQIADIVARLPLEYRNDATAARVEEAIESLRLSLRESRFQGTTIEGSAKPPPRKR